jgi:hypothetical protein
MINIKNLSNKELPIADLDLFPELDSFADSEDYLTELSNFEKDKVHGGRWTYGGGACDVVKVWVR